MPATTLLSNEAARSATLLELGILGTPPDAEFDAIVQAASLACEAPIALISLLSEDRQWFKAQVGLKHLAETARHEAFCGYTILGNDLLEVFDTQTDARFRDNPLVAGPPKIRFYAGMPLRLSDGTCPGTLCVIDDRARSLDDRQRAILRSLAIVAAHALENWGAKRKHHLAVGALARNRHRIDDLVAATHVGTWEWEVQTGALRASERFAEIFGWAGADLACLSARAAFATVHPDDRPGLKTAIRKHLAAPFDSYDHEYRIKHRDGGLVWVRSHGKIVTWTPDGRPELASGTLENIGDRKDQETALAKSRAFLDQTGRLAGVGGWELDLASGAITWSAESFTIHGVGPDFTPTLDGVLGFFAAEARPDLQAVLARAAAGEGGWDLEFPLVQANGTRLKVRTVGSALYEDGKPTKLVGAIQDVTEQVAQRRALAAADEWAAIATETAGIGVWEWDIAAGTMVWGSHMFGLYDKRPTNGVLAYDEWLQCLHPDDRGRADLAARTAAEGRQPYDIDFRVVWADGSIRFIHATARTYGDHRGCVTRMMGVNWDVTEARLLESERDERERELRVVNSQLERTARHLVKARDSADQASRAKSRFLASMSHELRTPLNGILGYAQLLQMEGGLNASQGSRLGSMLDAGTHLLDMINSVLELSEIESGHVELHLVEVDLSKLVLASLDLVQPRATAKGLRLSCSADLDAPRLLVTDPMRLRQIILNLLGNAVKFADSGQVELRLRAVPNRAALRIEIADAGPGIKPEQREYLFKDFERLQADISGTVEGAGLGLALSSRLAALLGGHLGYDDNPGGGSIFWMELPLDSPVALPKVSATLNDSPAPRTAKATVETTTNGANTTAAPRLRVLVVDDVAMNRDIACSFLRVAGHVTVCVDGGAEAVDAVSSGDFDVVLMDVRMPEVDGLEATRRIRRLMQPASQVPIIGLTAQAFTEQVLACTEAGMDGHVSKPYTPDALRDAVSTAATLARDRVSARRQVVRAAPPERDELPVLDMKAVERMAEYLAPPVLATFLRTIVSRCQAVSEALRTPGELATDNVSLAEATHVLAGSAGMLGFARLADDGVRLEHALRAGSPEVTGLAGRLAATIKVTLTEIDKLSCPDGGRSAADDSTMGGRGLADILRTPS